MGKNKFKRIFIEVENPEGEVKNVDIRDLNKEDYEDFLDLIDKIKNLYNLVKANQN